MTGVLSVGISTIRENELTDAERYMELQRDVLTATKNAIEQNAVGLPVAMLAMYISQVGGSVMIWTERDDEVTSNPFRIQVTTEERINIENATKTEVVKEVKGWG